MMEEIEWEEVRYKWCITCWKEVNGFDDGWGRGTLMECKRKRHILEDRVIVYPRGMIVVWDDRRMR